MKQVIQLDADGYFCGFAIADESPLEPDVFLLPGGCIEAAEPTVSEGQRAKWNGAWVFEDISQLPLVQEPEAAVLTYAQKRAAEYPPMADYLDAVVKGDQAQIDAYITDCLAVKAKYPKEQTT
jgi:hypothetical protein